MVKLRVFEKNLPDECRNTFQSLRSESLPSILQGLSNPSESSLTLWLPSIHRFLDIYKLSNSELSALVSLLYSKVFHSDISLDGLCVTLRLLNRCLSLKSNLRISVDWREFYEFYQELIKTSNLFLISKRQVSGVFEEIAKCIKRSRKYFSDGASREILEFFGPKLCPGGKYTEAMMWICNLMPNKGQGSSDWIESVLDLMYIDHRNLNWTINVLSCLSTAAKNYPAFNWSSLLPRLYNEVLPSLPLLSKSLPRPRTFFFEPNPTSNLNTQYIKKSSAFAKIVAYTLNTQSFPLIEQWLKNMQGTIKEGKMVGSGYINYISRIVNAFCKRTQMASQGKIPQPERGIDEKLARLVLPLIRLIFYSGQISQIDRVCSQLSFLMPQVVIPELVKYSVELLQDYEIPHLGVIQLLTGILRPMTEPSIYSLPSETLQLLLNLTLSELSAIDIQKSCKILSLYGQLACYSQISDEIWGEEFFSSLLKTLAELEVSNTDSAEPSRGVKIEECIELNMNIIVDNVSENIYENWVDEFISYISRNNQTNAILEFATIGKFLVRKNPTKVLPRLIKLCENLSDSAKSQIQWRVGLLTEAILYAGQELCTHSEKIQKIANDAKEDFPEESAKLLSALIQGCLDVYPLELSCKLPQNRGKVTQGKISHQSQDLDMHISWNLPTELGVSITNEILNKYFLQVPSTKQEIKNYLKIANVLVMTWATYMKIPSSSEGFVKFPVLSVYEKLLDYEVGVNGVIHSIQNLGFISEDPILLESFVEFVSNAVHCNGLTFAYVRIAGKLVNELRRNNFNPLIAPKEKNLNETRPYLVLKTHNLYRKLVSSNYCQKTFTGTFEELFTLLLTYAQSQFKQVRTKAITSIKGILKCSFIGLKSIIQQTWEKISNTLDLTNCEKLKTQMELLVDQEAIWRKSVTGENLSVFNILAKTQQFSDIELQTQFFNYFCNYVMSFYPNCRLSNKKFVIGENALVTEKILELISANSITHWRSQIYLLILILLYKNYFRREQFEPLGKYLTGLIVDENFDIRETAQRVLGAYLWLYTKVDLVKTIHTFTPAEYSQHSRFLNLNQEPQPVSLHIGWSDKSFEFTTKTCSNTEKNDEISEFFMNRDKVEKFFEYSAVGHMLKSEENIVNNPRTRINDNVNSSIKFLNNPHKFLDSFFSRPYSGGLDFSYKTSTLIQCFGELYGESKCEILFKTCEKFILREKPFQATALEVIAGLGCASRTWNNASRLLQCLNFSFRNSAINSVACWNSMLSISLKKLPPSVQIAVYDNLLDLMTLNSNKKLSKVLKLLANISGIISWRGSKVFCRFFEVLRTLPHDIFADLRTSVSKVISKIVTETSWVDKLSHESESLQINETLKLRFHSGLFEYLQFLNSSESSYSNQLLLEILEQLYYESSAEFAVFPLLIQSLPQILGLLRHPDIKIVTKASDVLKLISPLRTTALLYTHIYSIISQTSISDSKVQEMIKGLVLTMMWYYNQFLVTPPVSYFYEVVNKGNLEVKQTAKFYLTMIWRIASEVEKELEFERILQEPVGQGMCFRLSALVLAQKEFVEKWKGQALVRMGRMKKMGGEIGLCVNSTLGEFWKFHKVWWNSFMRYAESFTAEELEDIESFNPDHTYFS